MTHWAIGMTRIRSLIFAVLLVVIGVQPSGIAAVPDPVVADGSYEVVALGASNTEGRGRGRTADGVSREQAYPAQLEQLLNAQGCHVRVLNAGKAGDTTAGMLARLPGVLGPKTKLVILQPGGNDERTGDPGATSGNIAAIAREVAAHKARLLMFSNPGLVAGDERLPDGQHFSARGHARFAAWLAPQVRAAGVCGN